MSHWLLLTSAIPRRIPKMLTSDPRWVILQTSTRDPPRVRPENRRCEPKAAMAVVRRGWYRERPRGSEFPRYQLASVGGTYEKNCNKSKLVLFNGDKNFWKFFFFFLGKTLRRLFVPGSVSLCPRC